MPNEHEQNEMIKYICHCLFNRHVIARTLNECVCIALLFDYIEHFRDDPKRCHSIDRLSTDPNEGDMNKHKNRNEMFSEVFYD